MMQSYNHRVTPRQGIGTIELVMHYQLRTWSAAVPEQVRVVHEVDVESPPWWVPQSLPQEALGEDDKMTRPSGFRACA